MKIKVAFERGYLEGAFFIYAPSQVTWVTQLSCGPGTATGLSRCAIAKSSDVNGDSRVDMADMVLLLRHWGACGEDCAVLDLDCDEEDERVL